MQTQLKQLRKAAGFKTMGSLADALGVKYATYKSWETGERNFTLEQACTIADVLKCSLDELAGRTEYIGRFSDRQQAELNEIYTSLDEANRGAAVGAVRGIASNQTANLAREKTGSDGLPVDNKRTA